MDTTVVFSAAARSILENETVIHSQHPGPEPTQTADDARRRVDDLNRQAETVYYKDVRQALEINRRAEEAARRIDYRDGLAISLLQQGYCNQQLANNELALRQLLEAFPLFEQSRHTAGEVNSLKLIGDIYHQTGGYTDALAYYFKSLIKAEVLDDAVLLGSIYVSIGVVYGDLEDFGESRSCYLKALQIFRDEGHKQGEAVCLNNLGGLCRETRAFDEGLGYLYKAVELAEQIEYRQIHVYSLIIIAEIYRALGDMDNSLVYLYRGLVSAETTGDRVAELECFRNLSEIALSSGDTATALEYCRNALSIAESIDASLQTSVLCRLCSEIHEAQGDIAEALQLYKRFHTLDRELVNAEAQRTSRNLRMQFEIETSQKEAEIHRLRTVELANALKELEAANEELLRLNRDKSEFMSIAAHDLRNPLITINNDARSLHEEFDMLGNEDILRIARRSERSSRQMLALIANLLDYNMIELGRFTPDMDDVDWRDYVEQTVDLFSQQARAKQITVHTESADGLPPVRADRYGLGQVVENLLSNALKFSPPESLVTVRLRRAGAMVRLEVQDEGPGLTAADKEQVFGKFKRLSARPTGGEESTGLGLSIVKKMTEAMNGRVWCESESGKGACFIVELPAAQTESVS